MIVSPLAIRVGVTGPPRSLGILSAGVYYLRLETGDQVSRRSVVIQA